MLLKNGAVKRCTAVHGAVLLGLLSNFGTAAAEAEVRTAQAGLASAQMRLSSTPTQVAVANIVQHSYPIYTVTVTAKLHASVKFLDCSTASVISADAINGKCSVKDRYVVGDPQRNVPADPLDIPDESAMRESTLNAAIATLQECMQKAIIQHGRRFAILAEQANARGDHKSVVENCVNYLFAYPTRGADTDKVLNRLNNHIQEESGLVSLQGLLHKHFDMDL